MAIHELKTLPEYFQAIIDGDKTFEVRKNDREYQVGDRLHLREWSSNDGYTGRETIVNVTYILDDPNFVSEWFVVMSIVLQQPINSKR